MQQELELTTWNRKASSFTTGLSSGLLGRSGNAGYKALVDCPYPCHDATSESGDVFLMEATRQHCAPAGNTSCEFHKCSCMNAQNLWKILGGSHNKNLASIQI
jgi:hypothetical protein